MEDGSLSKALYAGYELEYSELALTVYPGVEFDVIDIIGYLVVDMFELIILSEYVLLNSKLGVPIFLVIVISGRILPDTFIFPTTSNFSLGEAFPL